MIPTTAGIFAAVAIIVAFVAGSVIEFDNGTVELTNPVKTEGPLEKIGEVLDDAAKQ